MSTGARPQRVLLRRGLERRAALAHDLPGGSGNSPCSPAALQTSRQIASASSSRGISTSRSPLLMVTDSRCGNANSHSTRPPTTPRIGRHIPRRIEAEMRVDDGAEFRRRLQARQQRRGRTRRNRQHDDVVRAERDTSSAPNFSSPTWSASHRRIRAAHGRTGRWRPCPATA